MLLLKGACMSGKTYFLTKIKRDVKGRSVSVFDVDELKYWDASVIADIEKAAVLYCDVVCDDESAIRMKRNLQRSERWEQVVKKKMIELAVGGKVCLLNNVLNEDKENDVEFLSLLRVMPGLTVVDVLLTVSVARYSINILKRKDRKDLNNTWRMRKNIARYKKNYDEVIKNSLFGGVRKARKKVVEMLLAVGANT